MSEVLFNPFDPAFRADPYPFYDELRTREPVHRSPFGMVVLSRYADIVSVLRNPAISRDLDANADFGPGALRDDPEVRRRRRSMLSMDPPDHTRLRRLVQSAFTPSAIERLRLEVEVLVDAVLDAAAERGELELIDDLAFPVPFQVISDLLDMPTDRAEELRDWAQILTASLEPTTTEVELAAARDASDAMGAHVLSVIEHRRRNLGDDVLSGLIAAEESGDRLSSDELISTVILLYVAGHETTVNLIGNGTLALLRNRKQLEIWRDDPALDSIAVDELLRFDGPVQLTARVPVTDLEVGGEMIAAHTPIFTVLGAANHDPEMFDDPHALRLDRPDAGRHLAFAAGPHYCLGASLAKLEAQVAIGRLIRRFPNLEAKGEPEWRDRLTIRGVSRLELAVR